MDQEFKPNTNCHAMKIRSGLLAGKGLGDVVADFTHATHIDKLAECYTQVTGNDCGCEERRAWLNQVCPG